MLGRRQQQDSFGQPMKELYPLSNRLFLKQLVYSGLNKD